MKELKLPLWVDILVTLKQGFNSMNLEDLYSNIKGSRYALFQNLHLLLDKNLIERDYSNNPEDKRIKHYILTIQGYDCADYFQKIKKITDIAGTNKGLGVLDEATTA